MTDTNKRAALGFGASGAWGQAWFSQDQAIALIHQALEGGIRHFDTAGFYARGLAEKRLGIALAGHELADDIAISTKTGTIDRGLGRKAKDFTMDAIRRDLDSSLRRLHRDKIDCLYLHGPDHWIIDNTAPLFAELKAQGVIQRAGVCGHGDVLKTAIDHEVFDAVMGLFNFFDQGHRELFMEARAKGVHVASIAPLAQAFYRPGFYRPVSIADSWAVTRAIVRDRSRIAGINPVLRDAIEAPGPNSAAEKMLAFALSENIADVVLTTSTKSKHLDQSLAIASGPWEVPLLKELSRMRALSGPPEEG